MADTSIVFDILARDRASTAMDKVKRGAVILGAAVGALAVKFGKDSVSAFIEAEQAQDKLQFALNKFPGLADTNIDRLGKLNTELAKKTKFDDDATASGQAVLAQFVTSGHQLEKLTPLLQDYAAKTGKDLPTAAASMGKAFLGNTRALKELGINYTATGDKQKDMAAITDLMREKVGGFAEKEGKSAAGQAEILKNQFGELEESAGSKLVPALTKIAGVLLSVIGFVQENSRVIGPLVAVLGTVAGVVWAIITAQKVWVAVQTALNIVMSANPIGLVIIAIAALVAGIIFAYKKSETFRDIVHGALHAVGDAFFWLRDTAGAVLGWIKDKWDWLKEKVSDIGGAIGSIVRAVFNPLKDGWNTVRDWIGDKWSAFKDANQALVDSVGHIVDNIFGPIRDAWTSVREWIGEKWAAFKEWIGGLSLNFGGLFNGIKEAFRSSVNTIIGWWNNLSFGFGGIDRGPIHIPGFTVGTPNIPYLAEGGIVTRPTLAVLGESGSEAVVPLSRGGGIGTTINITVNALDPAGAATAVKQAIEEYVRRNGPLRGLTA